MIPSITSSKREIEKSVLENAFLSNKQGGEGGIRTLDTFRYTRSPGARTRPDYATSPFCTNLLLPPQRAALYHNFILETCFQKGLEHRLKPSRRIVQILYKLIRKGRHSSVSFGSDSQCQAPTDRNVVTNLDSIRSYPPGTCGNTL